MQAQSNPRLVRLSDSDLTVVDTDDDVRGRTVKDKAGEELGEIDDLLIDPDERKVRFVVVASGGFLGMGEEKSFIPVDAVTGVGEADVTVDLTREHIAAAPKYDPDLMDQPDYLENAYGYYGYSPFWGAGYVYPGFPRVV